MKNHRPPQFHTEEWILGGVLWGFAVILDYGTAAGMPAVFSKNSVPPPCLMFRANRLPPPPSALIPLARQGQNKTAPPALGILHPDAPSVQLRNGPHQRESQPSTAQLPGTGFIDAEERLKDIISEFIRDTISCI